MGRGWVGRDAVSIRPRDYPPSFLPTNRRHCPGRFFESTNKRNPMQTVAGTKSAVDQRLISGTASALRSWLLNSVPAPVCLCKPFSCKACPGINLKSEGNLLNLKKKSFSNPKPGHTTGRSNRGGAWRSGEVGRGWVGRDAVSIRLRNYPPSFLPANRRHCPGRLFESTNKRNPM